MPIKNLYRQYMIDILHVEKFPAIFHGESTPNNDREFWNGLWVDNKKRVREFLLNGLLQAMGTQHSKFDQSLDEIVLW